MKQLVIWDFDGTLVDTLTDVALSFNEALATHGFPQHPLEDFGGFVGGNLETVISRMLPRNAVTTENINLVKYTYRDIYLNSTKPNTKPYPGIPALLDTLAVHGVVSAINSNKGQLLLEDMENKIFSPGTFGAVVGYEENRPSKPDPHGVWMICRQCGLPLEEAIYVGDGASDIETASQAGIPCVLVDWGQGTEKDRSDPRLMQCVHTAQELQRLLLE